MENIYFDLVCPILDIGNRMGATQYLDFLSWDEVTYPVMKGTDIYGRYFIVIKMLVNDKKIMQTFFKRYSDGKGWMGCGHATANLIETPGCMKEAQIQLIKDIINEKNPILKEEHIPVGPPSKNAINKKVFLYDERKIKAAVVIQRAWLKCRYDPSYKMCYRVQNNNLEIIMRDETKKLF